MPRICKSFSSSLVTALLSPSRKYAWELVLEVKNGWDSAVKESTGLEYLESLGRSSSSMMNCLVSTFISSLTFFSPLPCNFS
jgi:hypothetical protein